MGLLVFVIGLIMSVSGAFGIIALIGSKKSWIVRLIIPIVKIIFVVGMLAEILGTLMMCMQVHNLI